jgi:hypothetical protein
LLNKGKRSNPSTNKKILKIWDKATGFQEFELLKNLLVHSKEILRLERLRNCNR